MITINPLGQIQLTESEMNDWNQFYRRKAEQDPAYGTNVAAKNKAWFDEFSRITEANRARQNQIQASIQAESQAKAFERLYQQQAQASILALKQQEIQSLQAEAMKGKPKGQPYYYKLSTIPQTIIPVQKPAMMIDRIEPMRTATIYISPACMPVEPPAVIRRMATTAEPAQELPLLQKTVIKAVTPPIPATAKAGPYWVEYMGKFTLKTPYITPSPVIRALKTVIPEGAREVEDKSSPTGKRWATLPPGASWAKDWQTGLNTIVMPVIKPKTPTPSYEEAMQAKREAEKEKIMQSLPKGYTWSVYTRPPLEWTPGVTYSSGGQLFYRSPERPGQVMVIPQR